MTTSLTQTFNRDDIRRVYASFAADYKIVAEWTELHGSAFIEQTITQIGAIAEEQYLREIHMQLKSSLGAVREAAVYRVSTNVSGWSSDRPGDLYWTSRPGDTLNLIVFFSQGWWDLPQADRDSFAAIHMPGWGSSDFDGNYGPLIARVDRQYASRAYGIDRTRYST